MKTEETYRLPEKDRYILRVANRVGIGSIIVIWGSLLTLRSIGIIDKSISTWPFAFTAFGVLLLIGGIYRYNRGLKRSGTVIDDGPRNGGGREYE